LERRGAGVAKWLRERWSAPVERWGREPGPTSMYVNCVLVGGMRERGLAA